MGVRISGTRGLRPAGGGPLALTRASFAHAPGDLMQTSVSAVLKIAITRGLITVGRDLIHISAGLITLSAALISVGESLLAVCQRLLTIGKRLLIPRGDNALVLPADLPVCGVLETIA